jgi:hypothetical protein
MNATLPCPCNRRERHREAARHPRLQNRCPVYTCRQAWPLPVERRSQLFQSLVFAPVPR